MYWAPALDMKEHTVTEQQSLCLSNCLQQLLPCGICHNGMICVRVSYHNIDIDISHKELTLFIF
eukprot:5505668-Amphidinium_carterae.1